MDGWGSFFFEKGMFKVRKEKWERVSYEMSWEFIVLVRKIKLCSLNKLIRVDKGKNDMWECWRWRGNRDRYSRE